MAAFCIELRVRSQIVMPAVAPRLDVLLQEAMCRCWRDWETTHDLPLAFDEALGVYQCSQIVFGSGEQNPLYACDYTCPSRPQGLDRHLVRDPNTRPIEENKWPYLNRMTRYPAIRTPRALFYGNGDGERCAQLLTLLDGIGREYGRGSGGFKVAGVRADTTEGWRLRSVPAATDRASLPYQAVPAEERLLPRGPTVPVLRPRRILREGAR